MSVPVHVQHVKGQTNSQVGSFTPTWLTGIVAGNLLVILVDANAPITTPSGWNRYIDGASNPFSNNPNYLYLFWKIAVGGDAAPTLSKASGLDPYWLSSVIEISGVDTSSPFDGSAQIAVAASGASTVPAPSITTSGADRLVFHVGANAFSSTDFSTTPPGGTTFLWRDPGTVSGQEHIAFDEAVATASVVPARNMTRTAIASSGLGMSFAVASTPPVVSAKTGSVVAGSTAAAADARTAAETGAAVASASPSAAAAFTASETGVVEARGLAAGDDAESAVVGKTGSLVAGTTVAGADSVVDVEAGTVDAGGALAGADSTTSADTGTVSAAGALAGTPSAVSGKTGAVVGGVALTGDDEATHVEAGVLAAGAKLTGASFEIDDPGIDPIPVPVIVVGQGGTQWRFVLADMGSRVTTFIDKLGKGRSCTFILGGPASATATVPSSSAEINLPYLTDEGVPLLHPNVRLLYGFRREGGSPPWVCRFGGIVMQVDDQGTDLPTSTFTAFDPWQLLMARPILNGDGELPGENGLSFSTTRGDTIAMQLLGNTIAANGPVALDTTSGTIEATDTIETIHFDQGSTVGEAWQKLVDTGTLDIVLTPVYDPIGSPGVVCVVNIYSAAGSRRDEAIFAWDMPSRSVTSISRAIDGRTLANVVQGFAGQGGDPVAQQRDLTSIASVGEYWAQFHYPGTEAATAEVVLLALRELVLRRKGLRTITFDPAPERSPSPFTEYWLGDIVPLWASRNLREPITPELV